MAIGNSRNVRPPLVTFKPSMWGDIFSSFSFDDQVQQKYGEEIEEMKKEARNMLMAARSTKLITLIDTLERLGLGFHFETEIEDKLRQVYEDDEQDYDDLFTTALRFRLLRQHQYHVSCNVFEKFVGEWKETLVGDAEGLLSLYDAAQALTEEESILEEALEFTRHHLSCMLLQLKSPLKEKVQRALKQPLHRSIPIVEIRLYIPIYEKDESRVELLLQLAKRNFNFLQNMYRLEISQLLRWWTKFELKSKLVYTRDRMVECYFWGMAHNFEPKYSYVRRAAAINYQFMTVIDDTYDNYSTLEEAEQFTQAVDRWGDIDDIDNLPDYMKTVYEFTIAVYENIEREAEKQDKSFILPYYREAVKDICKAYNEELKWIMEGEMPSFEAYMHNSVIRSCAHMTLGSLMPGISSVTKETIDWMLTEPKMFVSSSKIQRLLDDLATHERENREGKLLTIVDCYMKDKGVSKQEALSEFEEMIKKEWKDMNEEWVKSEIPKEMLVQFVSFVRGGEVTYNNSEDGYTNPEKVLAPLITALLLDPILISILHPISSRNKTKISYFKLDSYII